MAGCRDTEGKPGGEAKDKRDEENKRLEADGGDAQDRRTDLKADTAEAWEKVRESFSSSMDRLKSRVESFRKNTHAG